MNCPKCGSSNVNAQIVQTTKLVNKHKGLLWWICVGLWWVPCKWFFLTVPALLAKIFVPKRQKLKQKTKTEWVCQNCGHHWNG